jgi:hypothetical protein
MSRKASKSLSDAFAYSLDKQGLFRSEERRTIAEIADGVVGIHAARAQSPAAAVLARSAHTHHGEVVQELADRSVIKIRCVRGTLHYCGLEAARVLHAATLRERLRLCQALKRPLEIDVLTWDLVQSLIIETLNKDVLSSRVLESLVLNRLPARREPEALTRRMIRIALKELWERGEVFSENGSHIFGGERRLFGVVRHHFKDLELNGLSRAEAVVEVVRRHIDAFGPVALEDIAWWSSLGKIEILAAISILKDSISEIYVTDFPEKLYMNSDDVCKFTKYDKVTSRTIRFLAWEDSSLKAYNDTRSRYVSHANYPILFNQIGEARAAILLDSKVIGVWTWDQKAQAVGVHTFPDTGVAERELAVAESARLANSLSLNGELELHH